MAWRPVLAAILGLVLAVPAAADPGEEFPEGQKPEGEEVLPGSDEEATEEESIDVLGALEGIVGRMKNAEESLAKAGAAKAVNEQGEVIEDANELLESADLQRKAIEQMTRIFDAGKNEQDGAVRDLERLIKAAKEGD
ncbi:MAG: hypothetical protein IT452_09175 [Planctomycetia bacterium]|nr:hypothetical protein [Planctomycetia bacterium]